MVSSIAVLFGAPRSNGAMVALRAANLEPHEFIRGSSQKLKGGDSLEIAELYEKSSMGTEVL